MLQKEQAKGAYAEYGMPVLTIPPTVGSGNCSCANSGSLQAFAGITNSPPNAQDDSHFTSMNAPLELNVAQNDSDPDGDPLTYSLVSGPSHGSIIINPDGTTVTRMKYL